MKRRTSGLSRSRSLEHVGIRSRSLQSIPTSNPFDSQWQVHYQQHKVPSRHKGEGSQNGKHRRHKTLQKQQKYPSSSESRQRSKPLIETPTKKHWSVDAYRAPISEIFDQYRSVQWNSNLLDLNTVDDAQTSRNMFMNCMLVACQYALDQEYIVQAELSLDDEKGRWVVWYLTFWIILISLFPNSDDPDYDQKKLFHMRFVGLGAMGWFKQFGSRSIDSAEVLARLEMLLDGSCGLALTFAEKLLVNPSPEGIVESEFDDTLDLDGSDKSRTVAWEMERGRRLKCFGGKSPQHAFSMASERELGERLFRGTKKLMPYMRLSMAAKAEYQWMVQRVFIASLGK